MGIIKDNLWSENNRRRAHSPDATPLFSTKRQSWEDLKASGRLYDRQERIMKFLAAHGPATLQQIATALYVPVNCVTGPVNELRKDLKLIDTRGTIINPISNKSNKLFYIL